MKIIAPIVGLVLLFTMSVLTHGETKNVSQLEEFINIIEENDGELQEWRLYTRGVGSYVADKVEYANHINHLMTETNMEWTLDGWQEEEYWKVTGTSEQANAPFQEKLTIHGLPQGNQYSIHLSYEIRGKHMTDRPHEVTSYFENRLDKWFESTPQVFTTIVATQQRVDDLYTFGTSILHDLSADKVEELKEETFLSISAYNNNWESSIKTNGQKMNLQVALRQDQRMGTKTTVTLGTPIITTEY